MELTREEAIRNYREHWASNAITGVDEEHKNDYLKRNKFPKIKNNCFLCEFVQDTSNSTCLKKCPIEWPATSGRGVQPCMRSYYNDWCEATTPEERKRLAAIIRDLPEKEVEEPKRELKIGDWVKVLSTGNFHSTWEKFFVEYNLIEHKSKFKNNGLPAVGEVLQIKAHSGAPLDHYGLIYVLQSQNGQIYLSNNRKNSLKLTEPPKPEPKFKPGDKVVPVSKSVNQSLDECSTWQNARKMNQPYLFVVKIYNSHPCGKLTIICSEKEHGSEWRGDHYLESDLRPYVEPEVKKEPEGFKVGDRVKCIAEFQGRKEAVGKNGTIIYHNTKANWFTVKFDCSVNGHLIKKDCWDFYPEYLELSLTPSTNLCPEPKTYTESKKFTFKGNKTVCTIEIDGMKFKGVAKCDPNDEWDEKIGRQYAELRANRKMLDAVEKELRRG